MIGLVDPKLWNLGMVILSKWNSLKFFMRYYTLNIVYPLTKNMFARGNCRLSFMTASAKKMHLLLLVLLPPENS